MPWNPAALPDQRGRTFVVTGGNAGLGYFTCEQLARTGARVLLASRSEQRADAAIASIRARVEGADLGFVRLDLSSLDSVRELGHYFGGVDRVDGLVLNAGMTTGASSRRTTDDGNELTLGVNFLGHFALTALAWPAIERSERGRVVGLGSLSTRIVRLRADDLQSERRFDFFRAYAFSKHAVHGFILELGRRLLGSGSAVSAVLAHPGFALDALSSPRPGVVESSHPSAERALAFGAQGKNRGAAPIVQALLDPSLGSTDFIGPRFGVKGPPALVRPVASSADPEFGRELWRQAEEWTGTSFTL